MANPQQGYPPYPQPGQEQYQQEQYEASQQPGYDRQRSPNQDGPPAPSAGGTMKKKRAYAGQAYDFGGGANSALGGQQPAGGNYPAPGGGYGAYPQQNAQEAYQHPPYGIDQPQPQVPAYGQPPAQAPAYGQPPPIGGYQSPDPGYPTQGAAPLSPIGGITQGMGNLGVGGHPQQQPAPTPQRPQLNQLYPSDLLNQALNVAELDLPPPPIILPPNVRDTRRLPHLPHHVVKF